jgi:hypothetical protein
MKNIIYPYRPFVFLCILLFYGCDDFVETEKPNSQLTTNAVFENITTANAAMADIYAQMRENGFISGKNYGLSCLLGAYSDELISYENGSYTTADFYHNSLLSSDQFVSLLWNGSYNQIYAANAIIEGTTQSVSLTTADKRRLQGEALFVRAFIHFNLVNVFGEVPYVTTTDYQYNSTVTRIPVETVFQNIITDLEAAIELLPTEYISTDRTRANKAVAQALLARVYLYHGDNEEATNMASAILNDTAHFIWSEDLNSIFLKDSKTTIWQLAPGSAGANTDEATTFIFYSGPPSIVSLSEDFVNQFETGDFRKQHWVKEITNGTNIWYQAFKYKQDLPGDSSIEYSIQFRLAEQYLIRAEAQARQGELTSAKEDLNKIRHSSGLTDVTVVTQEEVLDAILKERRFELFTEQGHRFFDLKRFGKLNEVLATKVGWNANDQLWPLPQAELLANPFLRPQNPGY